MRATQLEPGVLNFFRLGVAVGVLLSGYGLVRQTAMPELPERYYLVSLFRGVLVLTYLHWPWAQRRFGRLYLPVALAVAVLGQLLEQGALISDRLARGMMGPDLVAGQALLFVALAVPVLLISWQYGFWSMLLFTLGTTALEMILALPLRHANLAEYEYVAGLSQIRTIVFLVIGYVTAHLVAAQRAQRAALAEANALMAQHGATLEQLVISRERNRLARELHDILAHTLSAVAVQLEGADALWEGDPSAARSLMNHGKASIREGLTETRRAIQALRARPLEDLGLVLALRELAESVAARNDLTLCWREPDSFVDLPAATEQAVYRIADAALANVVRHAHARTLAVQLAPEGSGLVLTIADDGVGFDPVGVPGNGRYGLRGMHERAELIGGQLWIESQAGAGTTVRLFVDGPK